MKYYIKNYPKYHLMKLIFYLNLVKIGDGYQSVYAFLLTKVPVDWRGICVFTSAGGM
jgi:hypothetical protein